MTDNVLIDRLAQQILHWRVGPDRFMTENRSWLPKWRFNPLQRLEDAFLLLDASTVLRYVISKTGSTFQVEVECGGRTGSATDHSGARAISLALARSLRLGV